MQMELQMITALLLELEYSPVWSRYIILLVPREAMHQILSNASYAGIGCGSPHFKLLQWQVTHADLVLHWVSS
jgi:hypothetical protein